MLVLAAIAAIGAFLFLYAGLRGVHWAAPWKLVTTVVPNTTSKKTKAA